MKQNSNVRIGILLIAAIFLLCSPGWSQAGPEGEKEVVAKGLGAVIGGDEAKAADDALTNALRSALEQVIGTMVSSEVLVQNYQVVEDRIYSRTEGYIKTYEIIGQSKRGENLLEMTVRAVVKTGNLKNDMDAIGLLISQKNKPRMMVLIEERNMHHYYYAWYTDMNTSENEITSKFLDKGFTFVDRDVALKRLQRDAITAAIEGDPAKAKLIAQQAGAEVLITGKAISKAASGGPKVLRSSGMVSCQATINLKAVRADDGTVIAATSQQAAAVHIDNVTGGTQALQKAAGMAAEELIDKILQRWSGEAYSVNQVQITVISIASFADLVKFKNLVKQNIRGVQNIYQRDFAGNSAVLDLDLKGDANQVAEELVLKDFSPYQVEVVNVSQNIVSVKVQ